MVVLATNFWGDLIRQLRSEQKISQRRLATGAKVNRSTLRRIEDDNASGDIDVIERLLDYLGYELEAMNRESKLALMKRREQEALDPSSKSRAAASLLLAIGPSLSL